MFSHIEGELAWNAIYLLAAAGEWAVIPVEGPVCVPSQHLVGSIPLELEERGVVVVSSGADLQSVIIS
jgi:hypothetical protein